MTMVKRRLCSQIAWVGVLIPLLTACGTLGKLLKDPEHCSPQL